MIRLYFLLLATAGAVLSAVHHPPHTTTTPTPKTLEDLMHDKMDDLQKLLEEVSRQLMLQQLYVNERIRNSYNSGVKQLRYTKVGPKAYSTESHTGPAVGAIHDHPEKFRTVGMGELDVVLNGIDFKTRHNDYKLRMPSHGRQLHAEQDLPLPGVPGAVLHVQTVQGQVQEMREWFQAWQTQNATHRPYQKYFKPVMCYLEGSWMKDVDKIVEPTQSGVHDHHMDALTQEEMQQKIRFAAYSGIQSPTEDLAYLPRYVMNVKNGTLDLARWNYRIACHPLKEDLPLNYLHLVDDLSARVRNNQTMREYGRSHAARFHLSDSIRDRNYIYGLLDKLMQEVPGKDNYNAVLEEDVLGEKVYEIKFSNITVLNAAFYHRWYKVTDKGAMGVKVIHRGFADSNLFIARTTQPEIASMTLKDCHKIRHTHNMNCTISTRSYSFAIPLEIIYLTPLHTWNPYQIQYKGDASTAYAQSVTANNRDGGASQSAAYDGSNSQNWYHTPKEFFNATGLNPQDKSQNTVGVLDSRGTPRQVLASGIRTTFPVSGLGQVRTRFPILPVHGEGLAAWKELDGLKDIMMNLPQYSGALEKDPAKGHPHQVPVAKPTVHFLLGKSDAAHGFHTHTFNMTFNQMEHVGSGNVVTINTSTSLGHSHHLVVYFHPGTSAYEIKRCDNHAWACPDGHPSQLTVVPN